MSVVAAQVTGNPNWISSTPALHVPMPAGYEAYQSLGMAAFFYLLLNVLGGMTTGGETRYFASRNSREASLQCLLQGLTVMFRWPLMIGFAILGSTGFPPLFQTVPQWPGPLKSSAPPTPISQTTTGNSTRARSFIIRNSLRAGLINQLKSILGPQWQTSLPMVSSHGTVNPEIILPAVLLHQIPSGLRGLMVVALLSALMGALTGQVNSASALFVRDIYQNLIRPSAQTRELISMAYLSSALIVTASFLVGMAASSINDIWGWFIMSLTAGALGPGLLRFYWWRTNAWE